MVSSEYRELLERVREIGTLEQAAGILTWDERTCMPPGSAPDRAKQQAVMAGIIHERLTSKELGRLIRALKNGSYLRTAPSCCGRRRESGGSRRAVPGELVENALQRLVLRLIRQPSCRTCTPRLPCR